MSWLGSTKHMLWSQALAPSSRGENSDTAPAAALGGLRRHPPIDLRPAGITYEIAALIQPRDASSQAEPE